MNSPVAVIVAEDVAEVYGSSTQTRVLHNVADAKRCLVVRPGPRGICDAQGLYERVVAATTSTTAPTP